MEDRLKEICDFLFAIFYLRFVIFYFGFSAVDPPVAACPMLDPE
jgi:hypothetical protein